MFISVKDVYNQHPEFEKAKITEWMVDPERIITLRAPWVDDKGTDIKGKTIAVSGFGNVAWGTVKKVTQLGAKVISISGPDGYIYNQDGVSGEKIDYMLKLRTSRNDVYQPMPTNSLAPHSLPARSRESRRRTGGKTPHRQDEHDSQSQATYRHEQRERPIILE